MVAGIYNNIIPATSGGTGNRACTTTAEQLPAHACRMVKLVAASANAGKVYVGFANTVVGTQGADNEVTGIELSAGQDSGWIPVSDTSMIWVYGSAATQNVSFMWLK